mgnify:CR=1 FL=1
MKDFMVLTTANHHENMFAGVRAPKVYKARRENPSDREFIQMYRFIASNVEWLAKHFLEDNGETRGGALSSVTKMNFFLRLRRNSGWEGRTVR